MSCRGSGVRTRRPTSGPLPPVPRTATAIEHEAPRHRGRPWRGSASWLTSTNSWNDNYADFADRSWWLAGILVAARGSIREILEIVVQPVDASWVTSPRPVSRTPTGCPQQSDRASSGREVGRLLFLVLLLFLPRHSCATPVTRTAANAPGRRQRVTGNRRMLEAYNPPSRAVAPRRKRVTSTGTE